MQMRQTDSVFFFFLIVNTPITSAFLLDLFPFFSNPVAAQWIRVTVKNKNKEGNAEKKAAAGFLTSIKLLVPLLFSLWELSEKTLVKIRSICRVRR